MDQKTTMFDLDTIVMFLDTPGALAYSGKGVNDPLPDPTSHKVEPRIAFLEAATELCFVNSKGEMNAPLYDYYFAPSSSANIERDLIMNAAIIKAHPSLMELDVLHRFFCVDMKGALDQIYTSVKHDVRGDCFSGLSNEAYETTQYNEQMQLLIIDRGALHLQQAWKTSVKVFFNLIRPDGFAASKMRTPKNAPKAEPLTPEMPPLSQRLALARMEP